MNFAEQMARAGYNRSSDLNDPQNANSDWRAGYAVGRYTDTDSFDAINQEWNDRGQVVDAKFAEWKAGYWAGRFARIDDRLNQHPAPSSPPGTQQGG